MVDTYISSKSCPLGAFAYLSGPLNPEFIVDLLTYSYPLQNYNEKSENTKKVG